MKKEEVIELMKKESKRYSLMGDMRTAHVINCTIALVEQIEVNDDVNNRDIQPGVQRGTGEHENPL